MKKKLIKYSCFVLGAAMPFAALAQRGQPPITNTGNGSNQAKFQSPITYHSTAEVLNGFFKVMIQIGAVAVTLAIVYAGFLFVVARGNPAELTKAKETLKWTIIGALVLLGAQVIAKAIENTIKSIS